MENRITISICDEEYTFVAEEAPSYMQKVGSYVNDKMSELLDAAKVGRTDADEQTAAGKVLTLILALNYSSRSEITRAVRKIAARAAAGGIDPAAIDERTVSEALDTAEYPDPDLIVRTSGECRLSNFLLWQASYAELYFPEVLWPDFTEAEFDRALAEYARRDRRFGLVK